jgi:hypothetical protein
MSGDDSLTLHTQPGGCAGVFPCFLLSSKAVWGNCFFPLCKKTDQTGLYHFQIFNVVARTSAPATEKMTHPPTEQILHQFRLIGSMGAFLYSVIDNYGVERTGSESTHQKAKKNTHQETE